jgi:hypothetical protein
LLACSDNEAPPGEDHVPTSYTAYVDDVEVTEPLVLTAGQAVQVRLKFFNAAGEDLDEIESTHFASLIFEPAALAAAVRSSEHHYQFEVTGAQPGTGTVQVSFGHDEAADEHPFDPVAVTVMPEGGAASSQ